MSKPARERLVARPSWERLADELEWAGLPLVARDARNRFYDDIKSPLPFPKMQLGDRIAAAIMSGEVGREPELRELRLRLIRGEFDSTTEEWAEARLGA